MNCQQNNENYAQDYRNQNRHGPNQQQAQNQHQNKPNAPLSVQETNEKQAQQLLMMMESSQGQGQGGQGQGGQGQGGQGQSQQSPAINASQGWNSPPKPNQMPQNMQMRNNMQMYHNGYHGQNGEFMASDNYSNEKKNMMAMNKGAYFSGSNQGGHNLKGDINNYGSKNGGYNGFRGGHGGGSGSGGVDQNAMYNTSNRDIGDMKRGGKNTRKGRGGRGGENKN